ncbi:MAG: TIM barrel protein [Clostridiaceae bacterium]|nr:TIM barrel protein [Clostridiaceae bacterium]
MWKTGLTSITFRKLSCREIIDLAARAGLNGIEWGGDGHVRPGYAAQAAEVAAETRAAGLEVLSLGSYYRPGSDDDTVGTQVLELCRAMDTKMLRVWAGKLGSLEAEGDARRRVVDALIRLCDAAAPLGITVATEYHANTLTDHAASTLRLLQEVSRDNFRTYWQPVVYDSVDVNVRALASLLPHSANIHVFSWAIENGTLTRQMLETGAEDWACYLDVLRGSDDPHSFMIEFVRDDDPAVFLSDAATLNRWIRR